jgi:hypothetical protein
MVTQIVKKFPAFYETWRFITVFTRAHNWSLSGVRCLQSTLSYPIYLRSILILSSYLCLHLPSGFFPSGFPTKILYRSLISPMHVTYPTNHILLDLITLIIFGEMCKLWSSSLCSPLQGTITSSLLGPNEYYHYYCKTINQCMSCMTGVLFLHITSNK